MHILVDGYNISLEKGTGIATYAKNLVAAIQKHHQCSVLYSFPMHGSSEKNKILNEILLFDAADKHYENFSSRSLFRKIKLIAKILKSTVFPLKPRQFKEFNYIEHNFFKTRFPASDTFMNLPDLYDMSMVYFFIFKKLMKVYIKGVDIAHWTYPVPVRAINAKNIYTIHDLVPLKLPGTTLDDKRYHFKMTREICRKADHIITVSEHSKNDICSTFNLSQDFVSNTYQVSKLSDKIADDQDEDSVSMFTKIYNLKPKEYFLAMGALEPKKNYQRLFEAYMSTDIQKPLVVIGPLGWKYDKEMALLSYAEKTYAENNKNKRDVLEKHRIIRLGYIPRKHLQAIIKGALAMVFPSLYEGFGLPVLEAMQLGSPVITSKVSSLPEVGGNAPIYIDPYSSESIRAALLKVCREPELCKKMSARGIAQAKQFNMKNYSKRVNEIYESVMKK